MSTSLRRLAAVSFLSAATVLCTLIPAASSGAALTKAKVSEKAAVKTWLAANGLEVVSLQHQEPTIGAHPNVKSTALYDGCYAFAGALTNAVKLPHIANSTANKKWVQVLAHFEAATEDCFMGISTKKVRQVQKARGQLTAGNKAIADLVHLGK